MTDTSTRIAGTANERVQPNVFEYSRSSGTMPGQALVAGASGIALGRANAAGTSNVAGLATVGAAADEPGFARFSGPLTLTTPEWDAVTGGSGGLTPGSYYYLSAAVAGQITATPPSSGGQFVAPVGLALSETTLLVLISPPTAAGG